MRTSTPSHVVTRVREPSTSTRLKPWVGGWSPGDRPATASSTTPPRDCSSSPSTAASSARFEQHGEPMRVGARGQPRSPGAHVAHTDDVGVGVGPPRPERLPGARGVFVAHGQHAGGLVSALGHVDDDGAHRGSALRSGHRRAGRMESGAWEDRGMFIVVGVTGGIAAYKTVQLVRLLVLDGHDVHVIPTQDALRFVGLTTWEAISRNPVTTSVHEDVAAGAPRRARPCRGSRHRRTGDGEHPREDGCWSRRRSARQRPCWPRARRSSWRPRCTPRCGGIPPPPGTSRPSAAAGCGWWDRPTARSPAATADLVGCRSPTRSPRSRSRSPRRAATSRGSTSSCPRAAPASRSTPSATSATGRAAVRARRSRWPPPTGARTSCSSRRTSTRRRWARHPSIPG